MNNGYRHLHRALQLTDPNLNGLPTYINIFNKLPGKHAREALQYAQDMRDRTEILHRRMFNGGA